MDSQDDQLHTPILESMQCSSSTGSAVVKKFHTAQTTALCITAANIAPISVLKVPLRSSSADLHIHGYLAAIGDRTGPHAPLKDSAALPRTSTRCHVSPSCVSIH
ncbi:hypothetical protein CK203_014742 [Vitis vinifera]|uniref:Uncharacterized protein n=1 Tax=Vitis vinifera TaxID=29760 RepID=A0A438JG44_VITVI|nr:hypothetical protein CK203_014742 [Vitis vinifera]